MLRITTAFLTFFVFTVNVGAIPSSHNYLEKFLFANKHSIKSIQKQPSLLSKKAVIAQWKQVGSHDYSFNEDDSSWAFSSRDTFIYDMQGNEIVQKSSMAHTGWNKDSLRSLDSIVYVNGKITESCYYNYYHGKIVYGWRSIWNYLNDGKTIVTTEYDWDATSSKWIPEMKDSLYNFLNDGKTIVSIRCSWDTVSSKWILEDKDSVVYNRTIKPPYSEDFTAFTFWGEYEYDSITSTWKLDESASRNDGECNSTTLVFDYKEMNFDDSISTGKIIFTFNSSNWTEDNIVEMRMKSLNPAGEYYDTQKAIYSTDRLTNAYYWYGWDNVKNAPYLEESQTTYYDTYKNDTLNISCFYNENTKSVDTNMYRINRVYDSNGNNITLIESSYNSYNKKWILDRKTVNTFAQISVPVTHFKKPDYQKDYTILQTAGSIRFSASNVIGLELYNVEGKLVKSIKQNVAPMITLNLTGSNEKISSGTYIARLICKDAVRSVPLVIKK